MLLGGAVFGALGLLFAPQVSSALLKGRDALRMPRSSDGESREEDDDAAESASSSADALNEKIRALNLAIDEFTVRAQQRSASAVLLLGASACGIRASS
jgi:gas vesicle protein